MVDATSLIAPDTAANQKAFPQSRKQKPGCGFPLIHLIGLFSLATGSQHIHEMVLLQQLWEHLRPGELLLGDRGFGLGAPWPNAGSAASTAFFASAAVPLHRISFAGTLAAVRRYGETLLRAPSARKRKALLAELLRVLAEDLVPARPGRREPRAVKKRPKSYPRLTFPRSEFRPEMEASRTDKRRKYRRAN